MFFLCFRRRLFSDEDISAFRICRVFHNDAFDNAVADDFSTYGGIGLDGGSRSGGKVVDGIARHEGIGGSVQIDADQAPAVRLIVSVLSMTSCVPEFRYTVTISGDDSKRLLMTEVPEDVELNTG